MNPAKTPVGLIAGWGDYPLIVARALKDQGRRVVCLGIKDHADRAVLSKICDVYQEMGLARLGGYIRYFRRENVACATMAGKLHKVLLFRPFIWVRHFPDWRFVRTFWPHFVARTQDRKDDTLLGAVISAFAEDGIVFAPATDFVPELLVKFGPLTGKKLTPAQQKDVEFGWRLAKEMGKLDVGQSVAVKGRAVLAVEAVEGTDECIRRAGQLCPAGGFSVVKVAKPQQDMRFDVPTIGIGTLETLKAAGGKVLAVEAEKTIIIEEEAVAQFARRHGLTVVAVTEPRLAELTEAA